MNERIRELAISDGIYDCLCDPYDKFKTGDYYGSVMWDLERFAELIVKECADYVQFYYKDHMCEVIAHDMKQHFGVE